MENQEKTTLELEEENVVKNNDNSSKNNSKKSLKWLWITLAIVAVVAIAVWCAIWAFKINGTKITDKDGKETIIVGLEKWFKFSNRQIINRFKRLFSRALYIR